MHCNLEELPKELSSVKSLKALVASHNKLTSPCLSHLSPLKQLNSLILSDNQLTSFPSTTLNSLTSLKKLSLANNILTSDGLPSFANVSATLEEIRLNGNSGITEIPELALEGNEASSSLSVLELSHTNIGDVKEIHKLQKLPKLINLGLRDTPLSRIDDYRTKVGIILSSSSKPLWNVNTEAYSRQITEMLPKLRILDNVRFDPLYLARKAKGKDAAADDHLQRRGKGGPLQSKHKQDEGWGGRAARDGADFKGKKRKMDDDVNDAEGAGGHSDARRRSQNKQDERGKSRGKSMQSTQDALPEQAQQDQEPAHVPARKRSKKNKKKTSVTQEEEGIPAVPVKTPKAVGGSLSDPKEASAKASKLDTNEVTSTTKSKPEAVDVHQLPKQISSVVGVEEVVASSKKSKDRSRKGHKSLKQKEAEKQEGEEKSKGDILALLAQEKEKVASIGGWD